MWTVHCTICQRHFGTEGGKACHKCNTERQLPNEEQSGAVQCLRCAHWFRSRGGLAVNKCEILPEPELPLNNLFFVMIMAEVLGGLEI